MASRKDMAAEAEIVAAVMVDLGGRSDLMLWRNNTGKLPDHRGRWISFGCPGSADILAVVQNRATGLGVLVGIECKTKRGRVTVVQQAWGRRLSELGGVYVVARCAEDAVVAVDQVAGVGRGVASN